MQLRVDGLANGGEGVARDPDGRVVFVRGALPGDLVEVQIESQRKSFARGVAVEVIDPSPGRREPPCRHVAEGCGGCDLQHATPEAAATYKTSIVCDALERVAKIHNPAVRFGGAVDEVGYRHTVRPATVSGRLGFRRAHSHDVVPTPECRVAVPSVRTVLREGRFGDPEVVIRAGTDGVVALASSDQATVDGVTVTSHESTQMTIDVAGHSFVVSIGSFFQSGPDAAALLVETVEQMVSRSGATTGTFVDLYSGVGLFAAMLSFTGRRVAVEVSPSAVADARLNLAEIDGAEVVASDVDAWAPCAADLVVADPSRRGLNRGGVATVVGTGTPQLILVSCDAGAFGRDAGLLSAEGYELRESVVLDLFPGTSHVEVVSHFTRSEPQNRTDGS